MSSLSAVCMANATRPRTWSRRMGAAAALAALLLGQPLTPRAEGLVLITGTAAPYALPDGSGFLDLLVAEMFRRVGVEASVQVQVHSERALINVNNGIDDGLAMRIAGLDKNYPNMLMIPERIIENEFVAYTQKRDLRSIDVAALKSHSVGYITGWKIFDRIVPQGDNVTTVRDVEQLFNMLRLGRAEIALYERWQGLWLIRRMGSDIALLEPPLARVDMYMYLHRKHAHHVGRVTAALREMKRDGGYQRIHDRTLKPLVVPGARAP